MTSETVVTIKVTSTQGKRIREATSSQSCTGLFFLCEKCSALHLWCGGVPRCPVQDQKEAL